jgi:hypothetical protein
MKALPGHSPNNMKSVSVIIARESEGRAVQRKWSVLTIASKEERQPPLSPPGEQNADKCSGNDPMQSNTLRRNLEERVRCTVWRMALLQCLVDRSSSARSSSRTFTRDCWLSLFEQNERLAHATDLKHGSRITFFHDEEADR